MQGPQLPDGLSGESDDRLVSLIIGGNEDATAILIVRYLGVINKIAARFIADGIEHEDFVQEGMIGFLSAVRTYNADRGCSFNTYARICVLNRVKKAAQFATTNKYSLLSKAVELDEAGKKPADFSADPEKHVLEQETLDWFSKEIGEHLSEGERNVFLLYLEGYEPSQVAEALRLSVKSVYNSLGRVRKKLKTAFHLNQNG